MEQKHKFVMGRKDRITKRVFWIIHGKQARQGAKERARPVTPRRSLSATNQAQDMMGDAGDTGQQRRKVMTQGS